jgi:hypothetical protein
MQTVKVDKRPKPIKHPITIETGVGTREVAAFYAVCIFVSCIVVAIAIFRLLK